MYLHMDELSEVLHKYFLHRCRDSVLFSLKVCVCVYVGVCGLVLVLVCVCACVGVCERVCNITFYV